MFRWGWRSNRDVRQVETEADNHRVKVDDGALPRIGILLVSPILFKVHVKNYAGNCTPSLSSAGFTLDIPDFFKRSRTFVLPYWAEFGRNAHV